MACSLFNVEQVELETYSKIFYLLSFKNGQLCHCSNVPWYPAKLKISKLSEYTSFFQKMLEKLEYLFFNIYCFLFFFTTFCSPSSSLVWLGCHPYFYLFTDSPLSWIPYPHSPPMPWTTYQCVYSVSFYLFVFISIGVHLPNTCNILCACMPI